MSSQLLSTTTIALFCLADDTCTAEFEKDCPDWKSKGKHYCATCAEQYKSDLLKAKCTAKQVAGFCGAPGPSPPGPGPSPPGPGPSPPGPGPSPPAPSPLEDAKRFLLDNSDANAVGGRCLDGSPAGYYYAEATTATTKWVLFLDGGGACYTKEDCENRSTTVLGSSKGWAPTMLETGKEMGNHDATLSGNPERNPDFYDGHRVYVQYCTADMHSGQRTSATADTWGFWFDGHLNLERIIADLKANHGMANATELLFSGRSAGGAGSLSNADFVSSLFPSATVKAAPQAGWFYPADPDATPKGTGLPLNFTAKEVAHSHSTAAQSAGHASVSLLWQSYTLPACAAAYPANESWYCGSVHNLYKYIETPLLIIENMYDRNQIFEENVIPTRDPKGLALDYISYYGAIMRDSIGPQIQAHGQTKAKGKDGLFFPSCLEHAIHRQTTLPRPSSSSTLEAASAASGVDYVELIGDWFFERNKIASHILIDECKMTNGQPCNPTGCKLTR